MEEAFEEGQGPTQGCRASDDDGGVNLALYTQRLRIYFSIRRTLKNKREREQEII
jgi:hypothetical protein